MKETNNYLPIISISAAALALGGILATIPFVNYFCMCGIPFMAMIAMVVGAFALKEQALNEVEKNTSMCGIGVGALTLLLCVTLLILFMAFMALLFSSGF